jgi:predicted amidophosphoribosyltransferase
MAEVIPFEWRRWADVLTWVPADAQALRRRGFDHMETLARALASQTGMRAQPTLIKQARADQRHLGRAQRRENASALFIVNRPALINPHHPAGPPQHPHHPRKLILIDDVFTTGATLEAASKALISAGARDIRVVTIARVW